ncbi:MAG: hypothetical protein MJ252_05975 [archaeon]|nr:hypothetical protein [archaeon]
MLHLLLRIISNVILFFAFYNIYKKYLTTFDQWENSEELHYFRKNNSFIHNESEYNIYEIMKSNEDVTRITDKLRVRRNKINFK